MSSNLIFSHRQNRTFYIGNKYRNSIFSEHQVDYVTLLASSQQFNKNNHSIVVVSALKVNLKYIGLKMRRTIEGWILFALAIVNIVFDTNFPRSIGTPYRVRFLVLPPLCTPTQFSTQSDILLCAPRALYRIRKTYWMVLLRCNDASNYG